MTTTERRRLICGKVSHRISEVTPPGLGRWDGAWPLVAAPADLFLDALDAFLQEDTPGTRQRIQTAADDLVRAWRRAGEEWERAGRPQDRDAVPA